MDIGTAKPGMTERETVPHHLIDVVGPDEDFNVARFQELAEAAISDIASRGRIPVLVGGTGLYIKAVVDGFLFPWEGASPEIRASLEEEAARKGHDVLYARLEEVDPEAAKKIPVSYTHLDVYKRQIFLWILTNPVSVDVNVHPAKREVRFSKGHDIFRLVAQAVSSALRSVGVVPGIGWGIEQGGRGPEDARDMICLLYTSRCV